MTKKNLLNRVIEVEKLVVEQNRNQASLVLTMLKTLGLEISSKDYNPMRCANDYVLTKVKVDKKVKKNKKHGNKKN